jgi:hypothetical protein
MKHHKPEDLFRAEKERALTSRNSQHARLLAEAKAAFDKLMAEGQAARKSGRPRKHPLPPLKTTSSTRPPMRPPEPVAKPAPVKAAAPAPKVEKAAKPPVKPAAKKAAAPAKAKRAATKPKAKRSPKR